MEPGWHLITRESIAKLEATPPLTLRPQPAEMPLCCPVTSRFCWVVLDIQPATRCQIDRAT